MPHIIKRAPDTFKEVDSAKVHLLSSIDWAEKYICPHLKNESILIISRGTGINDNTDILVKNIIDGANRLRDMRGLTAC